MIPKIIWQTYELEYKDLPPLALECANSWQEKNPDWEYKYVSAKEREDFVLNNFNEDWYKIYKSYNSNIFKANLWRYLCLYINGGIYVDLDMLCKQPLNKWIDSELDFIVFQDPPNEGYTESIFASSKNNLFLNNLLEEIKTQYNLKKEYKNFIKKVTNEIGYIIFTNSILKTEKNNFIDKKSFILTDIDKSKELYNNLITHYYASNNNIFGSDYLSWKNQKEN